MKKLTEEWLKAAQDDLDVIDRLVEDEHLAHVVAFHAQQCVEKVFKGMLEEHEIDSPKIYRLVTLFGKVEAFYERPIDVSMLQTLDALYVEARYPGELGLLPHGRPTAADAKRFSDFAKLVFQTALPRLRAA